jgi:predicted N-acetyltransferase YhbS
VHPDNKGKGIATLLVEDGIEEAKKLGVDIFVLAFKAGRGIYQRLGFKLLDELVQDDSMYGGKGEYATYFMVYEVSTSKSGRSGDGAGCAVV